MRGGGAFTEYSVESLSLPETIKDIDDEALKGCPSLKHVQISPKCEGFISFDDMIFTKDYSQLLLIPEGKEGAASLPDQSTLVSATAFSRCSVLSQILVGDSATFTSYDGVLYSKDLKTLVACPAGIGASIVIPAETESIDKDALSGCKDLASITALGNVQKIDPTAFSDETKATAVVALPAGEDYDSRKSTWENAGFQHFTEPAQPGANTNQDTANEATGLTYTLLNDYTLSVSWQGKDDPDATLEIPASAEINGVSYRVSTIAENAFANRGSLTSVKLPTTITAINNGALAGCANLSTIDFPNTLRTIGERAFEATSLKDVWLPASINSIGSRAFASCSNLERVVALGTPEVTTDALAGCTNVSIYIPSGSEDTWNPGLPPDNNHLMPYGITLSEEPLALEAGQEADLLEGGNLQAPDPIKASYSYAAAPLSVDAGRVSAKKAGTSDVTAVLMLDDVELSRASRTVEVSPSPDAETNIVQLNSEVSLPSTYLADLRTASAPISVDAPFAVTFGQDAPYDVAEDKSPTSMEASAKFINNMDVSVRLSKVTCTSQNFSNVLAANPGAQGLMNQKLFSLYPEGTTDDNKMVNFGFDPSVNDVTPRNPGAFTISPKASSSYIFRLNLANAKVNPAVADAGITTQNLATVMCTFEAAPLLGFGNGDVSSSFYLKDKNTSEVYTAAEVKNHANAIASGNTVIEAAYRSFMTDENTYECKAIWGNTSYEIRIIGINHDKLVERTADGRTVAGLTFQFKDLLKTMYPVNSKKDANDWGVNSGGWGESELRARMNPGTDTVVYGTDDNEIWDSVPNDLKNNIETVIKKSSPHGSKTAIATTSNDNLFIASYYELGGSVKSGWETYIWMTEEGAQYDYWKGKVIPYGYNEALKKKCEVSSTLYDTWWERTIPPSSSTSFMLVNRNGETDNNNHAKMSYGVCPCFCL